MHCQDHQLVGSREGRSSSSLPMPQGMLVVGTELKCSERGLYSLRMTDSVDSRQERAETLIPVAGLRDRVIH